MFIATVIFWLGRNQYVRVPPAGMGFVREIFRREGLIGIARLVPVFAAVAIFWSLWDQTGSAWVLQAKQMDLHWLGFDWRPVQVQAANPILILVLIPLCSYVLYPAIDRVFKLPRLRKIAIGLFLTVPAFLITSLIETKIAAAQHPSISWQFAALMFVTALLFIFVAATYRGRSQPQARSTPQPAPGP